jgi:hypothetical protein
MKPKRSSISVTKDEIIIHWGEFLMNHKGRRDDLFGRCFACDFKTEHLDRAHIMPVMEGGSNKVDNLHCLCKICHLESELLYGDQYFRWFKSMSPEKRRAIEFLKYGDDSINSKFISMIKKPHHIDVAEASHQRSLSRKLNITKNMQSSDNMGRPSRDFTPEEIQTILTERKNGIGIKVLAKKYSIGIGTIYRILTQPIQSTHEPL